MARITSNLDVFRLFRRYEEKPLKVHYSLVVLQTLSEIMAAEKSRGMRIPGTFLR